MQYLVLLSVLLAGVGEACTNLLVTPGASYDGSSILSYNADAASFFGTLYHWNASTHGPDAKRKVYNWESGVYMGEIAEAEVTYNVVGNLNEFGVIITETTFTVLYEELASQPGAALEYGSLIYITLSRSRTAKEAINVMTSLVAEYGYDSEGESFSIGDPNEVWILEMVSKGKMEKGAVWVARKIPDGYVSAHANQARIRTFPLDNPSDTLYSPDVISFARKMNIFHGADEDFSFSDVYAPVDFSGARFCEARVWSYFSTLLGEEWGNRYLDYAQGYNLTNRMPLWVKPNYKLKAVDIMHYMRSHYEGTFFDMTGNTIPDVGSGNSNNPQRWGGLSFKVRGEGYVNERPIATQQTAFALVGTARSFVPREFAGTLFFGVDDASTTVRFPIYGSATRVPTAYAGNTPLDGGAPSKLLQFNFQDAFHVFSMVAGLAYARWGTIYPDLLEIILQKQNALIEDFQKMEEQAISIHQVIGPEAAVEFATEHSVNAGQQLVSEWLDVYGKLFVKYRDGYKVVSNPKNEMCACSVSSVLYPQLWYDRIVADSGDRYKVVEPYPSLDMTHRSKVTLTKRTAEGRRNPKV